MTLLRLRIWNTRFRYSFSILLQANFLKKATSKSEVSSCNTTGEVRPLRWGGKAYASLLVAFEITSDSYMVFCVQLYPFFGLIAPIQSHLKEVLKHVDFATILQLSAKKKNQPLA